MSDHEAFVSQNVSLQQQLNLNTLIGTNNKSPKLLKIEDYARWADSFTQYIYGYDGELWDFCEQGYTAPLVADSDKEKKASEMTKEEKKEFLKENKMYHQLTSALGDTILHQFKHLKTSKELWEGLKLRFLGNEEMRAAKAEELQMEFFNFICTPNEDADNVIERFCHLLAKCDQFGVEITLTKQVNKLLRALPKEFDMYIDSFRSDPPIRKLQDLIAKIQAKNLEIKNRDKARMKSGNQNPDLYQGSVKTSPEIRSPGKPTAYVSSLNSGNNTSYIPQSAPMSNLAGCSSSSNGSGSTSGFVASNLGNVNAMVAKEHMEILSSLLSSYDALVAGRIDNYMMTKEDYDQVDPEEMELMDIQWNLASVVRRAQRFMEVTGRQEFGNNNSKLGFDKAKVVCYNCGEAGHFKRECQKAKTSGNQNPFQKKENFNKQLVTHRSKDMSRPQQQQRSNNANANVVSTGASTTTYVEEPTDALVVRKDEGFSWDEIFSGDSAFVATTVEKAVEKVVIESCVEEMVKDGNLDEAQVKDLVDQCLSKIQGSEEGIEKGLDFLGIAEETGEEESTTVDGYVSDGSSSGASMDGSSYSGYLEKATLSQVYKSLHDQAYIGDSQ